MTPQRPEQHARVGRPAKPAQPAQAGKVAQEAAKAAKAGKGGQGGAASSATVQRFLNRELSWLEFNRRVLHQAMDRRVPLLERVGFLAIFNSNLDEFFQKRVGGLKRQIQAGVIGRTPDGLTPREQLAAIRTAVVNMLEQQAHCFTSVIKPALAGHGIHLLTWEQLTDRERREATAYFRNNLFPVLTPLAVDPGHPFPFISNLSTSLAVRMRPRDRPDPPDPTETGVGEGGERDAVGGTGGAGGLYFARVKVPRVLPRWVRLTAGDDAPRSATAGEGPGPLLVGAAGAAGVAGVAGVGDVGGGGGGHRLVSLEQIIRHNLGDLFEGMELVETEPFRITRNADVEREEEDAEDLLEMIEQELRERRFATVIRLEVNNAPDAVINRLLIRELGLDATDVYQMPAELDYTDLSTVHSVNVPELKFEPWTPVMPPRLADADADVFSVIRSGDVLVHHPYESFGASVERFIRAAVKDPAVIAIKLTLYRTSEDSPFIPQIIRAAEAGKQVVCLVELKARFDEKRNLSLAQALEKAGVHVVYGIVGYKTHTKTALVVRREADGMRCYAHIGTGNYNSNTAQLYTDLGLFTCHGELTADLVELFHYLTGRSIKQDFRRLLIAPINMRRRFERMIDREIAHGQAWKQRGADSEDPNRPLIIAKMNSLEDRDLCEKLYQASRAGVRIQLIVRGFCCLRPGVAGLSDNITVMSVLGRFLEHSRIYYFHNNAGDAVPRDREAAAAGTGPAAVGGGRSRVRQRLAAGANKGAQAPSPVAADGGEYYIGSADWMYRNLNDRVECITPVLDPAARRTLKHIFDVMLADHRQAWDMRPDGSYVQRQPPSPREGPGEGADLGDAAVLGTHQTLMNEARVRQA